MLLLTFLQLSAYTVTISTHQQDFITVMEWRDLDGGNQPNSKTFEFGTIDT